MNKIFYKIFICVEVFVSFVYYHSMKPELFTYLDYRHYLKDLFEALKKGDEGLSYRMFAKMAGSSSPNFLQLIIQRKLNIGQSHIRALAESIVLSKKEEGFLETIVAFDHAKTHEEKNKYYRRMLLTREYSSIRQLQKEQYSYFSKWYLPVIRELVVASDFTGNMTALGDRIVPPVSASKVKKGIALLESLGLIQKDPDRYILSNAVLSTPSEVISLAVTHYHKDVIALAAEAIEKFPAQDRDIRAVTLGVDADGFLEVKQRLERFWKELLEFADTQKTPTRVVQVNMQLFPLTKDKEFKA